MLSKNKRRTFYFLVGLILCIYAMSLDVFSQTFSGKSNNIEIQIMDPELADKSVKPTVRWIYPLESVQTVNNDVVNLKLGISSKSPVVKVTLVVNNSVEEVFENFSQQLDSGYLFDAWIERPVQLQNGSNDIQLIVQNDQGALKHQRKIEVEISPSYRSDHALIFGIDEYDTWDDLQGPVRDAERIAGVLEEKGFNIEILRNSTTFSLLEKLEEYVVKEFQPHDQLFIYFAGHGHFDPASGEGYLVCRNSVNLPNANTTYLSYSAIQSIVNNIPAQHIFLLMDAVQGKGEPLSQVLINVQEQPNDDSNSTVVQEGKTRLGILSGSEKYPRGYKYSAGSPLSRAFITYLRKSEQTEQPTWGDLLLEFQGVDPDPVYVEFGDHSSGSSFTFRQPRSGID